MVLRLKTIKNDDKFSSANSKCIVHDAKIRKGLNATSLNLVGNGKKLKQSIIEYKVQSWKKG